MIFCVSKIQTLLNYLRQQTYHAQKQNKNITFSVKNHELSEYFLKEAIEELRNYGYNACLNKTQEYGIIHPPNSEGQPQTIINPDEPYRYDCAFWIREEFNQKLEKGEKLWIDAQYYHFNLNFLPPVCFGISCKWDDEQIYADFLSGDTAFWEEDNKYYCRKILRN